MEVWKQIQLDPEVGARLLVAEYGDRLFGAAVMLSRDRGAAEDLVFRTFERAVERIALYDPEFPFWNWLYSILLNFFRMDIRKNKAFVPENASFVMDMLEAESGDLTLSKMAEVDASMIREAIARLQPQFRETVMLRYFEDKTLQEMSELMSVHTGTVKWRLHQARIELGKMLLSLFKGKEG